MSDPADINRLVREAHVAKELEPQVREALGKICKPDCGGPKQADCVTLREYYDGWKKLVAATPAFGYKLLFQPQFRWPKPEYHIPASRKLPGGAEQEGITEELWNKSLAYRWVLQHLDETKRLEFLEATLPKSRGPERFALITVARFATPNLTDAEREFLDTAEASFIPSDPDRTQRHLAYKIRSYLYYLEFREQAARPVK